MYLKPLFHSGKVLLRGASIFFKILKAHCVKPTDAHKKSIVGPEKIKKGEVNFLPVFLSVV